VRNSDDDDDDDDNNNNNNKGVKFQDKLVPVPDREPSNEGVWGWTYISTHSQPLH
jgi:hypothetical protein